MVDDRMDNAYELAQKCWAKAYNTSPEFVEGYLELAKELLTSKPLVLGAIKYVVPTQSHNHMPVVTMWKSTLYNEDNL